MATKLKVLLQRVEAGVPLERGLAGATQMDGPAFQLSESLKAMMYFDGGDLGSLPPRDREILIRASQRVRELPHVTLLRGLSIADRDCDLEL